MKRLLAIAALLAAFGACTPDMRYHAWQQSQILLQDLIQRHAPVLIEYWLSRLNRHPQEARP